MRGSGSGFAVRCAVLFGMLLLPATARAQEDGRTSASECCPYLLTPIGARALALGGALTARPGPDGLFVNPALLADGTDDEFLVYNARTSQETSNTFSVVVRSRVAGSFALSYRNIDEGEQDVTDPSDNVVGRIGTSEHVLTATYATGVAGAFHAGVSYTLYQFRQDCRGFCGTQTLVGTTHGLDMGVEFRPPRPRSLVLGASLMHVAFPLQVVNAEQASPTPARLRLGGAYEVGHHFGADSTTQVTVSVDVVTSPRHPGETRANLGAELSLDRMVFVWAGYGGGTGITSGAAVGVGLNYSRFRVAVAKSFVSSPLVDDESFQVTFGVRF